MARNLNLSLVKLLYSDLSMQVLELGPVREYNYL